MKPRTLFVMDGEHFPELFGSEELARLRQRVELVGPPIDARRLQSANGEYAEVELIIASWGMPELSETILTAMPRLRVVFYAAGTIKPIATDASWDRGIRITSAAIENAKPTAEFTFAEIILSLKRTWERIFLLREQRRYKQRDSLTKGCYGSTVGLLSLGKIGRLVARRLASLDVRVIAYDPTVAPAEAQELGVRLASLEEVFSQADVVSCHMPSTSQTDGAIGRALLSRMKRGATFINTARGSVVNEDDLVAVLRERPDLYAVLDVSAQEPPPPDSPLFELPNIVLTPHIAGSMGTECRRMGQMMVDEVERYLTGQPMRGEVLRTQLTMLA